MRADPQPQQARDQFWLVIAFLFLWLACGSVLLLGGAGLIRYFLELRRLTWS
jgi:hypothetical protein